MILQTTTGWNGVCRRNGTRVDYEHDCLLHREDAGYSCKILNISLSGALVSALNFPTHEIRPGETCALLVCSDPNSNFSEYTSRITRVGPSIIALQFLRIGFLESDKTAHPENRTTLRPLEL